MSVNSVVDWSAGASDPTRASTLGGMGRLPVGFGEIEELLVVLVAVVLGTTLLLLPTLLLLALLVLFPALVPVLLVLVPFLVVLLFVAVVVLLVVALLGVVVVLLGFAVLFLVVLLGVFVLFVAAVVLEVELVVGVELLVRLFEVELVLFVVLGMVGEEVLPFVLVVLVVFLGVELELPPVVFVVVLLPGRVMASFLVSANPLATNVVVLTCASTSHKKPCSSKPTRYRLSRAAVSTIFSTVLTTESLYLSLLCLLIQSMTRINSNSVSTCATGVDSKTGATGRVAGVSCVYFSWPRVRESELSVTISYQVEPSVRVKDSRQASKAWLMERAALVGLSDLYLSLVEPTKSSTI